MTGNTDPSTPAARPVLLLDFDGTVCVGDGPVRSYAEHLVTAVLDAAPGPGRALAESLRETLEAYLDAASTETAPPGEVPADGYAAVAAIAAPHATPAQLDAAYLASRETLATHGLDVRAPDGLLDLLVELGPSVDRVLVTNAPARGVHETLARLGLDDLLDAVVTDARKPAGWGAVLPGYLDGRAPAAVLAVGDVWRNDVQPPLEAGCATALIDRFGHRAGPAHVCARTFEELFGDVRAWAADPQGFVDLHPPVVHDLGISTPADRSNPDRSTPAPQH